MENQSLCLYCQFAVWIREKADIEKLSKKKRAEFEKEVAHMKYYNNINIEKHIFPFIWCSAEKQVKLYPFSNKTLKCEPHREITRLEAMGVGGYHAI
jgi:hypothetical protein